MDGQVDGFNKALITRWPLEVGLICFPVLQTAYGVARSKCARLSLGGVTRRRLANSERGISTDRKPTSGLRKQNIQKTPNEIEHPRPVTHPSSPPWRLLFNQRQWNVRGVKVNLQCFRIEITAPHLPLLARSPPPPMRRGWTPSSGRIKRQTRKIHTNHISFVSRSLHLLAACAAPGRQPPAAAIDWLMPPCCAPSGGPCYGEILVFLFSFFSSPPSPTPAALAPFMVRISRGSSAVCAYLPLGSG